MIDSRRVSTLMKEYGLSQSELARRVGVSQPTIYKLLRTSKKGSAYLHRIARELRTTPAYLMGDTDDPIQDLPAVLDVDADTQRLIDAFVTLSSADRRALLRVAKSMADGESRDGPHQAD